MTTPKLRFKEFDGDWSLSSLSQLSTKIGDGIHATPKYDENGEIPFINGNNLIDGNVVINENTKRINAEEFNKYNQALSDRTLFLSINGTIGNLAFYKNEKVLLGKSVCFINLKTDIDKNFIYLLLQSPELTKTFNSELTGTTIKNLSLATVRNSEFYSPTLEEQTKIASFLSAVDEKISQLSQKHSLLSQYKQGMMQKLFSQQIRFKAEDGSEFGEWEETTLGSFSSKIGSGSTPRGGAEAYTDKGIIFIRSQNVNNDQLLLNDIAFIPEQTHKKMAGSKVIANDILLNITGASIGRSCVVPSTFSEGNVNQHVCIIRTPKDNPRFVQSFLASKAGQDLIESHQTGSGREGLNFQSIRSFSLMKPCLKEQTKIANFLSSIDQKIEVVAQQIEQAKQWKKGLLQQMFV
ncbi:restriction endonuclease subunit S [Acinetobacter sichuanensis]|uniref:Restriction endonuclease subunit S n=1 Tax=Acinetobacter sichuanensis TaxID=2136183 RepID=A0A371YT27_9GAMM|nr:restriction endonuclease subunit S [Acinetobacter sichuanensis]RFC84612.1 restriction endonuclease subunit S [Acinetobacter sichuanensis]